MHSHPSAAPVRHQEVSLRALAEQAGDRNEPEPACCSDCGDELEEVIGCPDGAEICPACFAAGAH